MFSTHPQLHVKHPELLSAPPAVMTRLRELTTEINANIALIAKRQAETLAEAEAGRRRDLAMLDVLNAAHAAALEAETGAK